MTLKRHWYSASEDPKLCKRKRHSSFEEANRALLTMKSLGRLYAEKLRPVACKTCHGWHMVKK